MDHACALDLGVVLPTVLASERHDDNLAEERDRGEKQPGHSLCGGRDIGGGREGGREEKVVSSARFVRERPHFLD